ncbi:hypothetical protein WR25_03164 isoform B [Diploscapter pachys]|nr:hypothetical protein WR25_03164 isoform B [Diploscapter pachys]
MRNTIRVNILEAFNNMIEKAHELGRVLQDEELAEFVLSTWSDMKSSGAGIYQDVPAYIGDMLSRLRLDKAIDDLLQSRNEYLDMKIDDGTLHFILDDANKKSFWRERMAQIFSDDYEVTTRDIPYSRRVTENQKKNHFRTRSFKIEFNDMGGQRSELIKLPDFLKRFLWGNGRTFVLYVASIADAFENDSSERQRSKLERSARVLDLILSLPTVSECGIMIFFNKYDRYEEIVNYKYQSESGREELADRIGANMKEGDLMKLRRGTLRIEQARELIKQAIEGQFIDICKRRTRNEVYVHYTQAVVRELMKSIFNSVEENIYNSIIANASYIRVA